MRLQRIAISYAARRCSTSAMLAHSPGGDSSMPSFSPARNGVVSQQAGDAHQGMLERAWPCAADEPTKDPADHLEPPCSSATKQRRIVLAGDRTTYSIYEPPSWCSQSALMIRLDRLNCRDCEFWNVIRGFQIHCADQPALRPVLTHARFLELAERLRAAGDAAGGIRAAADAGRVESRGNEEASATIWPSIWK